jgi:subtilisin family serine protease
MLSEMDRTKAPRVRLAAWLAGVTATALLGAGLLAGGFAAAGLPPAPLEAAGAPAVVTAPGKLYGQLQDKVDNAKGNDTFRVIVHLREQADLSTWPANDRPGAIRLMQNVAARTQPALTAAVDAMGGSHIYHRYWVFNGFAVEAPAATLRALAARPEVDYIVEDGIMTMPPIEISTDDPTNNWNIYQVRAPEVWALGYDGTGRTLANMDSGVQGDHPALATRWRGINGGTPANSWFDPYDLSPSFPTDPDGHGTHTMGTIAGYQGDPTGPNEIGQSKGAVWIAARNYDATGKGPFSKIHLAFQWFVDPDGDPNTNDQPDAVNNSWGDITSWQYPDLEWWQDVEAWRAVGIFPIFSNGNNGPGAGTAGKPGSYPIVVGTGAVNVSRLLASFSSRGPAPDQEPWNNPRYWERTNWGLNKPDVVAPGVGVRSSLPGSAYGSLSGTSMASPHVAGMVGLLRQIRPDLTFNEFYNIILETAYWQASFGTERPNNNFGWGEIDDYAAAIYVRDAGAVSGTITDGACAIPVPGAEVIVWKACDDANADGECGIRKLTSANAGNYRTILAAGTYTVTVSAPGYYGFSAVTTVMSTTTNTLPIVLTKMATGTVSGTVTDGSSPVISATVSVDGIPNVYATTNASGQYTLASVPAGNYTVRAQKCGYQIVAANVTVPYAGNVTRNFTMPAAPSLISDDFEDGDLAGWTVTSNLPANAIWHNSTLRALGGTHAARAGNPAPPYFYTGPVSTTMTVDATWDTSTAQRVWLSFDLYGDSESEYDIVRVTVSTDGGATWPHTNTVFGQASPVHGWRSLCIDITRWRSAQMKIRINFQADSGSWNNEQFEGPSVDNFRVSTASAPAITPVVAQTPTPGTPVPCTPVATATPTACALQFTDVPPTNTFYPFVRCLACQGIINGYPCGGTGEPCNPSNDPYFRPNAYVTRGQLAKIVSESAGFDDEIPPSQWTFTDVPYGSTFWVWVERLADRTVMAGYACGIDPNEPCDGQNRPYFRPNSGATRGQLTKIVSNAAGFTDTIPPAQYTFTDVPPTHTFWVFVERLLLNRPNVMGGYVCGGAGEPCDTENRPYFRPNNPLTRGQTSKIVANTFFPNCNPPRP